MFARLVAFVILGVFSSGLLHGASFPLVNGSTLEGEPISFNPQGMVVKNADGSFAPREGWTNFTQAALKELVKNPKAKPFVEVYVEEEEPESAEAKIEIKPKPIERLSRPDPKAGYGALLASGISLTILLLVYAGNIYAGYEVGLFRNYNPFMTAGIAAIAPVIGPIIFLCMPTRLHKSIDEIAAESMANAMAQAEADGTSPRLTVGNPEEEAAAAAQAVEAEKSQVTVYQRGQTSFNRRFFETKFAGFLKVVPGDAEKDKEIYIRSSRGEYVGNRLTRVLPNELTMQVAKGDATSDVIIPFGEIYEVQVRPRAVPAS
jgi:hypothetical protein